MNEFYSINTGMISSPEQVLSIFAWEFEKFDGLRPLALVELFTPENPVDCTDTMSVVCLNTLGNDLAMQGAVDRDALADICDACFKVREHFDKGGWITKGLQAYFVHVKKMTPELAEAEVQRLTEAADARYAEALEAQRPIKQAQLLESLKWRAEECETELANLRRQIEALSAAA